MELLCLKMQHPFESDSPIEFAFSEGVLTAPVKKHSG